MKIARVNNLLHWDRWWWHQARIYHEAEKALSPPLSPAFATFLVELCNPITRQAIELESCSNPLRIQQVL